MTDSRPISARDSLLALTMDLDELKDVVRDNPLPRIGRRENTAEHSWHVAMAALLWAPESPVELDIHHAVTLAVVHDFPEVFVGDTPVHGPRARTEDRFARELAAMSNFVDSDQTDRAQQVFDLWAEYEHETSNEAKFVMAVDVLLPVFHNHARLGESSWVRKGALARTVRTRIESVRLALPWLAERAEVCVAEAVEAGALRTESPA